MREQAEASLQSTDLDDYRLRRLSFIYAARDVFFSAAAD
jgi:hypothetical protein